MPRKLSSLVRVNGSHLEIESNLTVLSGLECVVQAIKVSSLVGDASQIQYLAHISKSCLFPRNVKSTSITSWKPSFTCGGL